MRRRNTNFPSALILTAGGVSRHGSGDCDCRMCIEIRRVKAESDAWAASLSKKEKP